MQAMTNSYTRGFVVLRYHTYVQALTPTNQGFEHVKVEAQNNVALVINVEKAPVFFAAVVAVVFFAAMCLIENTFEYFTFIKTWQSQTWTREASFPKYDYL
jgi:hypothetical protein